MTIDHLTRYARLLFGDRWQTQLAAALNLSERTIRLWVHRGVAPDRYANQIHAALIDRMHEINSALDDIERDFSLAPTNNAA